MKEFTFLKHLLEQAYYSGNVNDDDFDILRDQLSETQLRFEKICSNHEKWQDDIKSRLESIQKQADIKKEQYIEDVYEMEKLLQLSVGGKEINPKYTVLYNPSQTRH